MIWIFSAFNFKTHDNVKTAHELLGIKPSFSELYKMVDAKEFIVFARLFKYTPQEAIVILKDVLSGNIPDYKDAPAAIVVDGKVNVHMGQPFSEEVIQYLIKNKISYLPIEFKNGES